MNVQLSLIGVIITNTAKVVPMDATMHLVAVEHWMATHAMASARMGIKFPNLISLNREGGYEKLFIFVIVAECSFPHGVSFTPRANLELNSIYFLYYVSTVMIIIL